LERFASTEPMEPMARSHSDVIEAAGQVPGPPWCCSKRCAGAAEPRAK
jgi:hypothetical protein